MLIHFAETRRNSELSRSFFQGLGLGYKFDIRNLNGAFSSKFRRKKNTYRIFAEMRSFYVEKLVVIPSKLDKLFYSHKSVETDKFKVFLKISSKFVETRCFFGTYTSKLRQNTILSFFENSSKFGAFSPEFRQICPIGSYKQIE